MRYDRMTTADFDACLSEVMDEMSTTELLAIPGIYEVVSEHCNNEVLDLWLHNREIEAQEHGLNVCMECGAFINPDFGAEEPAAHLDAAGTLDDPRSPGDHDDICDVCDYSEKR